MASRLASGSKVCPACMRDDGRPFRRVAFAGLRDELSDDGVLAFDDAVGA